MTVMLWPLGATSKRVGWSNWIRSASSDSGYVITNGVTMSVSGSLSMPRVRPFAAPVSPG